MAEMEKSWEQKLAEAKAKEEAEDKARKEEENKRLMGTPHLINLNEDPMLDRKVFYDIDEKEPLMCGRRNKNSTHKLQLGGTGIEPDHAMFSVEPDGSVRCKAITEKAMKHIRINGELIKIING
jgi:kinesin family member 13